MINTKWRLTMIFIKEGSSNIIVPKASCSSNDCGCSGCSTNASKSAKSSSGASTSQSKNGFCGTTKS